jgi:hypothetical protein
MTAPGKTPKPKGAPKSPSAKAPRAKRQMTSVHSWEKVVGSAPWVGGQASGLNPGSTGAVGRRKNSPKFKARSKKVIRPRIQKQRKQADN